MDNDEPPGLYHLSFLLISADGSAIFAVILLIVLLLCSALVSGSEVAFFSLTRDELKQMEAEQEKKGALVREMREKPRTLLGTILVANNFINIAIVVLSEYIIWLLFSQDLFEQWAAWAVNSLSIEAITATTLARGINFLITVFGITFLLVLFGEIAPKIYARIHKKSLAGFMASPLVLMTRIFSPITGGLVIISNALEHWLSRSGGTKICQQGRSG